MAGNASPIWTRVGNVSSDGSTGFAAAITTATGDYTGVSTNHVKVFTADATNGGYCEQIRFKALGSNAASVARIYVNNGSAQTTATNNTFIGEQSLPITTATDVACTPELAYGIGFALDPGFTIWVGLATTVAAGWRVTAISGKY